MNTRLLCTINLALVLLGTALPLAAAADEDDAHPRGGVRTAARQYPDDEQPVRTAMADDVPRVNSPPPANVDSPSNARAKRAKARAAGESVDAKAADGPQETIPAPRGTRDHSARISRSEMNTEGDAGEVFGRDALDDDFGVFVPNLRAALRSHLWFRGEAMLWWLKGGNTPPLLTTSTAGTPLSEAGVLGQPGTRVLFGDEYLNPGLHAGGRMTFGAWLGNCEESGLEFSYMILGQNTQTFPTLSSSGNPILARPYFNATPSTPTVPSGTEVSQPIAYPGVWTGSFKAVSSEDFQGAEALWRRAIVNGDDGRIEMLLGYRYARLSDGLVLADTAAASFAPGTQFEHADSFRTQNDFNGAELGFSTQWRRGRWKLESLLKMGIGDTHTQVSIDGATAITTSLGRNVYSGGLLALASNSGLHTSDQFSVMPELGLTLSCDVTQRLTASIGYTLLYWSDVARPGDQIDLNVDTNQFPSGANPNPPAGTNPAYTLHTSDFWAQGVNLGLQYRF